MPFKSIKQLRWMYANHPKMARRWEAETPKDKKLPVYARAAKREKEKDNG
ncbi:MAG: hypothetical protein ACRD3O_00655 [Terriglobia bacterium]